MHIFFIIILAVPFVAFLFWIPYHLYTSAKIILTNRRRRIEFEKNETTKERYLRQQSERMIDQQKRIKVNKKLNVFLAITALLGAIYILFAYPSIFLPLLGGGIGLAFTVVICLFILYLALAFIGWSWEAGGILGFVLAIYVLSRIF